MLKQAAEAYEAALHLRGWPRLRAHEMATVYLDANERPQHQALMLDVLRFRVDWLRGNHAKFY